MISTNSNSDIMNTIITGDESWVYSYKERPSALPPTILDVTYPSYQSWHPRIKYRLDSSFGSTRLRSWVWISVVGRVVSRILKFTNFLRVLPFAEFNFVSTHHFPNSLHFHVIPSLINSFNFIFILLMIRKNIVNDDHRYLMWFVRSWLGFVMYVFWDSELEVR